MAAKIDYVKHPKAAKREMIPGKEKMYKTVFTRMSSYTHGPLSVLKRAVEERRRVKIWTRSFRYVRGICTGYVVMFDKHFNMALTDVDEVCIDPTQQKKVFQLEQDENTRASKKHKRRKKKPVTSAAVNTESVVKPTVDDKQTDVCGASIAATHVLAERSMVGMEDLLTDTMMSSLQAVSGACFDDCTTMVGGIGCADILGDTGDPSASVDDDCDLSMSTDGVHDKLRSSPRVHARRSTDASADVTVNTTAAVTTGAAASVCASSASIASAAASSDKAAASFSSLALQGEDNAMGFGGDGENLQVLSANCIPPYVVEHELSIMATSDLDIASSSSDDDLIDFAVVDEANNSSSTSEENLADLETKMRRIKDELAKLAAVGDKSTNSKKGHSRDDKTNKTSAARRMSGDAGRTHSGVAASRSRHSDPNKSRGREERTESKNRASDKEKKESLSRRESDRRAVERSTTSRSKRESELKTGRTDLHDKLKSVKTVDVKSKEREQPREHRETRRLSAEATSSRKTRDNSRHERRSASEKSDKDKKSNTGKKSDNVETSETSGARKKSDADTKSEGSKQSETDKNSDNCRKSNASKKLEDKASLNRSTRSGSRHGDGKAFETGDRWPSKDNSPPRRLAVDKTSISVDDRALDGAHSLSQRLPDQQDIADSHLQVDTPVCSEKLASGELTSSTSNVFMARAQRKLIEAKKAHVAGISSDNASNQPATRSADLDLGHKEINSANSNEQRESYDVFRRLRSDADLKHGNRQKKDAADSDGEEGGDAGSDADDDMYTMTQPRMQLPKDTSRLFSVYKPVCGTQDGLSLSTNLLVTRHVQQLLIRGDNVVMVAFADT